MKPCARCKERPRVPNSAYCRECRNEWARTHYRDRTEWYKTYYEANKERMKVQHREWLQANPEKVKAWRDRNRDHLREQAATYRPRYAERRRNDKLRIRYGIEADRVEELLKLQRGKCPICKRDLHKFHVDHDHVTGVVRGLLCGPCNRGLGNF